MRIANSNRLVVLAVLGVLLITYAVSVVVPNVRERSDILRLSTALQNLSLDRVETAVRAFARDHAATNGVAAVGVPLEQLVSSGYLAADDAKAFAGARVAVFLVSSDASNPQAVLAAAQTSAGLKIVLLSDGSVQQLSGARYRDQIAAQVRSRSQPVNAPNERR